MIRHAYPAHEKCGIRKASTNVIPNKQKESGTNPGMAKNINKRIVKSPNISGNKPEMAAMEYDHDNPGIIREQSEIFEK